jgi:hypothetical protein
MTKKHNKLIILFIVFVAIAISFTIWKFSLSKYIDYTYVRIKNVSPYDYVNITVGQEHYENLKAGDVTEYRIFTYADRNTYRYNNVRLSINNIVFEIIPKDYVGEKPLGNGYFAYLIYVEDFENKILSIKAVEDELPKEGMLCLSDKYCQYVDCTTRYTNYGSTCYNYKCKCIENAFAE